jgi:hypothetical protein
MATVSLIVGELLTTQTRGHPTPTSFQPPRATDPAPKYTEPLGATLQCLQTPSQLFAAPGGGLAELQDERQISLEKV